MLFLHPNGIHLPPHGQHVQHRYQQEKSPGRQQCRQQAASLKRDGGLSCWF